MSWWTAVVLLLGCAALGALLGTAPPRVRTGWLVAAALLTAFLVFLPGICATAIAASAEDLYEGSTSCRFLYGSAVPELGSLDGDETGRVLQLVAAVLAVTALLLVRRHRQRTQPSRSLPPADRPER
jgi:hypothetical protein